MRKRLLVVVPLVSLLLAGCSAFEDDPELESSPLPSVTPSADADTEDLERFYDQEVSWRACRESFECGTLTVPLDYAKPDGDTIELSLLRVPAADEEQRVGSLVVNPGGPGGSGVDYAARAEIFFGKELRAAFDIVGFDPRGVGSSTPIDCLDDAELDAFVAADPDPDDRREARQALALVRDFGRGCVEKSGDLASHVSTVEAARDMDVLRAALDQDRMAYFGASYGTFLGATYAELFPERVGRMVLDGAVDPSLGIVETSLVQAEGFETALRAYVGACVDEGSCFLGSSVDAGAKRISDFLQSLDQRPINGDATRRLTQGLGVLGVWAPLYDERSWSILDTALKQGFEGNGSTLLALADAYVGRGPDGFQDNSTEALYSVNCLDENESVRLREAIRLEDRFLDASPTFGRVFAFGLASCRVWPVTSDLQPEVLDAQGADPILVVGTSRDPATPLAWAEALAEELSSGVLVRRDGDGHTGYRAGNQCVDDTVERYLVSGVVPEGDVDC